MNMPCRKAYVSVNVDVDEQGAMNPRFIRWKNDLIYPIDRILYKCRAASQKVEGGGIRYTIVIRGRESFLFHEGNKWFVEAFEEEPQCTKCIIGTGSDEMPPNEMRGQYMLYEEGCS